MTTHDIDPDRSTSSAVLRPALGAPILDVVVCGEVVLDDEAVAELDQGAPRPLVEGELAGTLRVALDGQPPVGVDLATALIEGVAELSRGPAGELVLRGRRAAPANEFGILGPPLLNPTVVLSWRLVLDEDPGRG